MRPNCHSKEVNSNQRGCHLCTMWPKGQEPWRRGGTGFCKLSWQLLVPISQRPQQELEELRLDVRRTTKRSSCRTSASKARRVTCRSECKERQTAAEREHKGRHTGFKPQGRHVIVHADSFRKDITYPPQAETAEGYCTGWEPATWYQVLTTHGTCTLDLRSRRRPVSLATASEP